MPGTRSWREAAAALALAVGTAACGSASGPANTSAPPTQTSAATPALPTGTPLRATPTPTRADPLAAIVDLDLTVAGGPDFPVAAFGSVWVLRPDQDPQTLTRLDPQTGAVIADIPVSEGLCQATGSSPDAIWACSGKGIARIDPETNALAGEVTAAIGLYWGHLAFGAGSLWVLGGKQTLTDTLLRIDPAAMAVTDSVPLGFNGAQVAFGHEALWITAPGEGKVVRFDAATRAFSDVATGLIAPRWVTTGFGSVWVSLYDSRDASAPADDRTLARIDPATGAVTLIAVDGGPFETYLHAGSSGVWLRAPDPFIARIDPATNQVAAAVKANWGVGGVVELNGQAWVTAGDMNSKVWRLKPGAP